MLLWGYCNYRLRVLSWQHAPDHGAQKRWLDQMTDDTITAQLRRTILNKIESYEIEDLKRIAYEVRCEEMGIYPDSTYADFPTPD